jgi:hypothetical protein
MADVFPARSSIPNIPGHSSGHTKLCTFSKVSLRSKVKLVLARFYNRSMRSERIVLIHALKHSMGPAEESLRRLWPTANRVNLLDDSLSADLSARPELDDSMVRRFIDLGRYAASTGARGILFTCSAFGPCIDAVSRALPQIPVLKPNEAMIDEARGHGGTIGLVASFEPTLQSMPAEFGQGVTVVSQFAAGALQALQAGDGELHDRLVADAARRLVSCDVIALAQFSLARAADAVAVATGLPVLTTPDCVVRALKRRVLR